MTASSIERCKGEALYLQISRILEKEIRNHYEAGDCLPSEADLSARFSVNRHTLRRAVDELIQRGLLQRHHGKGTFVLAPSLDYLIHSSARFTETLEAQGLNTSTRVIRQLVVPATGGVARRLVLDKSTPVLMIDTLRHVNNLPTCIITHFLPYSGFEIVFQEYQQGSLHTFLEHRLNIRLQRKESLITAVLPIGDDARLLQSPESAPLLRVKSINLEPTTNKVLEYAITRWRADAIQLHITPH